MSKNKKVVSRKNLPTALPLLPTITAWLVLEKTSAAQWVWGVVGTLLIIVWLAALHGVFTETHIDLFNKGNEEG